MTFWEHFFRLLVRRPAPALAALYWHLTRRKVRARNRLRVASADLPFAYMLWIAANEKPLVPGSHDSAGKEWNWRPRFAIILYAAGPGGRRKSDRAPAADESQG